jgi:hypothetical protein
MFSYRHTFPILEFYFGLLACVSTSVQNFICYSGDIQETFNTYMHILAQKKWDWSLRPFSFAIFAISFKKRYPIINHLCKIWLSFVQGLLGRRLNKRTSLKTISQCHVMDPDGKIEYSYIHVTSHAKF